MSRFLRPAALAAAAAGGLFSAASWSPSSPLALSATPSSSPSTPVGPSDATGHIALVRAHPGLRKLNAMLTPASFLVDATQTLLGSALRIAPFYPGSLRLARDFLTEEILSAESESSEDPADAAAKQAVKARMHMALLYARDGCLDDALDAMSLLAAEHSGNTLARLYAAALCHVATTLGLVEMSMWSFFKHGDLSERLEVLALMAFLRGVVARKLRRDDGSAPLQGSQNATPN